MEKLKMETEADKKEFLETEFGTLVQNVAEMIDRFYTAEAHPAKYPYSREEINKFIDTGYITWAACQKALQTFYGLELHFVSGFNYYGICNRDRSFWLLKVDREAQYES
jgi:hypothetical protein